MNGSFSRVLLVALFAALPTTACPASSKRTGDKLADSRDKASPVATDTVRGTIAVTGAEPLTVVVVETGTGQIALEGPLIDELATLQGAEVSVTGTVVDPEKPPAGASTRRRSRLVVASYTIESIAGEKPVVGVLSVRNGKAAVGDTRLTEPPKELLSLDGAKVWVVGTRGPGHDLRVSSYGVLRTSESRP